MAAQTLEELEAELAELRLAKRRLLSGKLVKKVGRGVDHRWHETNAVSLRDLNSAIADLESKIYRLDPTQAPSSANRAVAVYY